ncbi:primosomal protein N' [Lichenifustis flavocetrariae]|uniref:Replication restart protein PriA n=1 Tax=Lichenifustis flavocetrariae TaxID=2949735 RepID=A0AA42CHC9_9HYPH|nr:primosomal protein N' [Lichenifustis flavocetrariae]MCW6507428.1 primosomal protein N' [Lichenifustis flavocetrariae]
MPEEVEVGGESSVVVDVLVPVAVDVAYSYRLPPGLDAAEGDFVHVPLGTRETVGVVWSREVLGPGRGSNLKSVIGTVDLPPLPPRLRRFIDWVARWTLTPRGMVLRMAVRAPSHAGPERVRIGLRRAGPPPARLTPARIRVLDTLATLPDASKAELARAAGCSTGVIDGLIDEGTITPVVLSAEPLGGTLDPDFAAVRLEPSQKMAAGELVAAVTRRRFGTILLEGVTGAGKTEVYFEAVAAALRASRQVLITMPEIALTAQALDRFAARFGARPAEWHSAVPSRRRARVWLGVASGDVQIVIGARSSLFLPFANLGLIVVDEEHDPAYKQEDGVVYHARDMAVVRGRLEDVPVVLASATPALETRVNAEEGRYGHLVLAARVGGRSLPALAAINLRKTPPPRGSWISPPLAEAIGETIGRGEQVLLFLNRRGYAPLTLCRTCGHRFQCPNCSTWLVEHRFRNALMCHHCGHVERRPTQCPACGNADTLVPCGPGVERLTEEVEQRFPAARTLLLSSDAPGGAEHIREQLAAIARHEVDLVIGTQLVAKGHNFPSLTLVGVVDADVGLANGDPRAAERTFQMLQQVTGRAGRGDKPGRGLIQTWEPDHPVMRALVSGDGERFYRTETEMRRSAGLPPFGRLAAVIVSGGDRHAAEAHARALARAAVATIGAWRPAEQRLDVLGPAEAPLALLRGRHRFRLLVTASRAIDLQGFLRAALAAGPKARGDIRVDIDVEPQSFL